MVRITRSVLRALVSVYSTISQSPLPCCVMSGASGGPASSTLMCIRETAQQRYSRMIRRYLRSQFMAAIIFRFVKQRSRLDLDLPDGTEDGAYLAAVQSVLEPAFAFHPDIIFFQPGVDGLSSDTLGRLRLTHEGLRQRDTMVFTACAASRIPCTITLGGGYSDPIESTVEAHANTFRLAADLLGYSRARYLCIVLLWWKLASVCLCAA